jgi:hypothetical protein
MTGYHEARGGTSDGASPRARLEDLRIGHAAGRPGLA